MLWAILKLIHAGEEEGDHAGSLQCSSIDMKQLIPGGFLSDITADMKQLITGGFGSDITAVQPAWSPELSGTRRKNRCLSSSSYMLICWKVPGPIKSWHWIFGLQAVNCI